MTAKSKQKEKERLQHEKYSQTEAHLFSSPAGAVSIIKQLLRQLTRTALKQQQHTKYCLLAVNNAPASST